jgi:hypothetical protein
LDYERSDFAWTSFHVDQISKSFAPRNQWFRGLRECLAATALEISGLSGPQDLEAYLYLESHEVDLAGDLRFSLETIHRFLHSNRPPEIMVAEPRYREEEVALRRVPLVAWSTITGLADAPDSVSLHCTYEEWVDEDEGGELVKIWDAALVFHYGCTHFA